MYWVRVICWPRETPEIFAAFLKTQVGVAPLGISLGYVSSAGMSQKWSSPLFFCCFFSEFSLVLFLSVLVVIMFKNHGWINYQNILLKKNNLFKLANIQWIQCSLVLGSRFLWFITYIQHPVLVLTSALLNAHPSFSPPPSTLSLFSVFKNLFWFASLCVIYFPFPRPMVFC